MPKVLLIAGTHPTGTVVCGDFNTKYGDPTCTDAVIMADLLDTAGFEQHVSGSVVLTFIRRYKRSA